MVFWAPLSSMWVGAAKRAERNLGFRASILGAAGASVYGPTLSFRKKGWGHITKEKIMHLGAVAQIRGDLYISPTPAA